MCFHSFQSLHSFHFVSFPLMSSYFVAIHRDMHSYHSFILSFLHSLVSFYLISFQLTSFHFMSVRFFSCHFIFSCFPFLSFPFISFLFVSFRFVSFHVMPCHAFLFFIHPPNRSFNDSFVPSFICSVTSFIHIDVRIRIYTHPSLLLQNCRDCLYTGAIGGR